MAVVCVLAQPVVGDDHVSFTFALERGWLLGDSVFRICLVPAASFLSERRTGYRSNADASRCFNFLHHFINGKIEGSGHRADFATNAFAFANNKG